MKFLLVLYVFQDILNIGTNDMPNQARCFVMFKMKMKGHEKENILFS